jgi:hypothetical protein
MAKIDPPAKREKEWNDWYNNRHVAARMALPGFLSGRRFTKIEGIPRQFAVAGESRCLALYDLAGIKVMTDGPYPKLREKEGRLPPDSFEAQIYKLPKFGRGVYEEIPLAHGEYRVPSSEFVFVVGHEVPRHKHKEFNAWYNTEHLPALMTVPGFLTGRRFRLSEREVPPIVGRGGVLPQYLTVYDIESSSVFDSEAFKKASQSPWSDWVRSWYTRKMCALFRRILPTP